MSRISLTVAAASLATLAAIAPAEPVVVTFPLFDGNGDLVPQIFTPNDIDSRIPALRLGSIDAGGAGISEVAPYIETDVPDWALAGTSDYLEVNLTENDDPGWWLLEFNSQPGIVVPGPDTTGSWVDSGVSMPSYIGMPMLRFYDRELYDLGDCDYTEANTELIERSPVLYYPFRVQFGEVIFHYGWVAYQIVDIKSFACDFDCMDDENTACMRPIIRVVGMGYETDWDTAITVGGGLCPADLTFDAILDLADVQAFAAAFVSQGNAADFDGNGIFDLADIQAFVTGFNTNCGL